MANLRLRSILAALLLGVTASADDHVTERNFTLKVLPLLKAKCLGCHGGDTEDVQGGLDVRSRAALIKGGESEEPALVPGDPEASPLYQAIRWDGLEMPPKENDRLTEAQIAMVKSWIVAGAPWPDEATQRRHRAEAAAIESTDEGVLVRTSGGLSDEWTLRRYRPEDLWAFRPVKRPPVSTGTHPVDYFISKRLAPTSIEPAAQADPVTLIRRATFDLTGLPPTPEQISAFREEWSANPDNAWEQLIDRLLASPHYGERWGQHWLDVARYADTGGYSNDYERSNMWRYRDYVIRSFNDDKPYDEFIVEQLAGDEIWEERPPGRRDPELLVATGFLRLGPWDPAMVKKPQARQIYIDDVVNAVGQTFLATTMRCVKCHDHKFDPIPTRDYYRMYAAFATTQLAERPASFLPEENREGFDEGRTHVERLLAFASERTEALRRKREAAARRWYQEHGSNYVPHEERKNLPDESKPPRHVGLDHHEIGRLKVREQDQWIWTRRLERYQPMAQSVYSGPDPKFLNARKLRVPGKRRTNTEFVNHILTGGALEAPGDIVQPGVLSGLGHPVDPSAEDPYLVESELRGRRLGVARWIAHENNPLTTRAIVNRIWQHHFGKPLAGNPNNFGVKGAKPTHPELLDWLSTQFVDRGWRMKRLHKLIMTSRAYKQSSHHPQIDSLGSVDPGNDLLAYFPTRRLSAEELRDAMLHVTGELNPTLGGLPVMPEINMEVALQPRMIQFSLAPAYQPSRTPAQRHRRSIYAYRVRGQANPFFEVFNQPNPNESCEARDAAAVSPQAFTLMNSDVMSDRSIAFAQRLEREVPTLEKRVERAFLLAFGRSPSRLERTRMIDYVRRMEQEHRGARPDIVTHPTRITRSLVEELSGKSFEYDEILPVFEQYVPDAKPADVGPGTRALADLCLALFNSNEFLYVY
ncbi:Planctomycete cytochrome C [Planctomycetes bacterium Pan216]|uniref:Planctomycete cytochrome C n=1 Tax=Kolteria novifilia TaxID=2527975 RepID=A0A518B8M5_9BACT|nr:Planctomycete cytochrome C [Planctomycetes bacterium Pan216]